MLAKLLIGLIIVSYSDLLLDRGSCPMYSRLLLNMYTNQNCVLDGKMNFLKHLQPPMVLSKAE